MNLFGTKPKWYQAGLAFECTGCGRCCAGPEEGYVWVTPAEIADMARFMRLDEADFRKRYVRREGKGLSLIEQPANNDCVFLIDVQDEDGQTIRGCQLYPVRPSQCRTWPFWPWNIRSPEAWALAGQRCPGINRGPLHSAEEIERLAGATPS